MLEDQWLSLPPTALLCIFHHVDDPVFLRISRKMYTIMAEAQGKYTGEYLEGEYQDVENNISWVKKFISEQKLSDKTPIDKLNAIYREMMCKVEAQGGENDHLASLPSPKMLFYAKLLKMYQKYLDKPPEVVDSNSD